MIAAQTHAPVRRLTRRDALVIALCALMMALLAVTGVLNQPRIWPDLDVAPVDGRAEHSIAAGDAHGIVASGPYIDLPAGEYRIKWQIEGDGEVVISLACSTGTVPEPARFSFHPGEQGLVGEGVFTLDQAVHNLSVTVHFASGTFIRVHNFRLYSPEYTDITWVACLALASVIALTLLRARGFFTQERREAAVFIALAALAACVGQLSQNTFAATDTQYHMARIVNLADALAAGQFPARVGGFSYNGYGAVTSVFYPDLLLYPCALMTLAGASVSLTLNLYIIAITLLSGAAMYAAVRRIFGRHDHALCAAVLYVLMPYRLLLLYECVRVGELTGLALMPLFLLGLYNVLLGDARRWRTLAISAALIFLSHLVSTLLSAALAFALCLPALPLLLKDRMARLRALVKAAALAFALCAFAFVPFAAWYLFGDFTPVVNFGFTNQSFSIAEALDPVGPVGFVVLLGIALLIASPAEADDRPRCLALWLCVLCACLAAGGMSFFPWRYLPAGILSLLESVLQFNTRLLLPATPLLAMAAGMGMARALRGNARAAAALALCACVLFSMPGMTEYLDRLDAIDYGSDANPYMLYPEYQLPGTDVTDTLDIEPHASEGVTLGAYAKRGTRITAHVEAAQDGTLDLPLFAFDGYAADVDGVPMALARGENNRLRILLPANTSGELTVRYEGLAFWRVGDALSLAAWLSLLVICIRRRRRRA